MKLGVVGSRSVSFSQCSHIISDFISRFQPSCVVSGGARGVDSHAERVAQSLGVPTQVFYPVRSQGVGGLFARNSLIAQSSNVLLAIYSGSHRHGGTKDTVLKAFKLNKKVYEVFLNDAQTSLF